MLKSYSNVFKTLFIISDILIIAGSWILATFFSSQSQSFLIYKSAALTNTNLLSLPLVISVHSVVFIILNVYEPKRTTSIFSELANILKATLISIIILSSLFHIIKLHNYGGTLLIYFWIINVSALFIFRIFLRETLRYTRSRGYNLRHILIVGTGSLAREVAKKIHQHQEFGLEIVGFLAKKPEYIGNAIRGIKVIGTYKEIKTIIQQRGIDQVVFALSQKEYRTLMYLTRKISDTMVDIRIVPDLRYHFYTLRHGVENFDGLPVINLRESPLYGWNMIIKKCFDFCTAFILLIIGLPLLVLVAVLIKIESPGPIFYRQERMGYDGKVFKISKFRSMKYNAEAKTGAVWAKENDPRRTVVGKIIRKTSIDEIPQLFNVLKGEMSLVGPRPERPVFIKQFDEKIPSYMLRHKMKAGITGWAQIHGLRGNTSLKKRIEYDLYYIENWSFWLDIKILFLTIPALLKGEGAY